MATQNYKVALAGAGNLLQPRVELQDKDIPLTSSDGGITWTNNDARVEVNGQLKVFMACNGINGTTWTFTVTNKSGNRKVVDDEGEIGDASPGYSETNKTVIP